MGGMTANLTEVETAARSAVIVVHKQRVDVDLSDCRDLDQPTFPVRSSMRLTSEAEETWLDFQGDAVTAVFVDDQRRDVDYDGARIRLLGLPTGRASTVVVEAAARYSRTGEGLHRFRDPADGETYLYTQYEPADARRVFPCFEQPDLKTAFTFTMTGPDGWQLLSNQPEVARQPAGPGLVTVDFAPTPPLATYLTCLVAGPYARVEDQWTAPDGTVVDLAWLCRRSLEQHLDTDELFGLTKEGLSYLERAFGPYTWGKYDQIFVPEYNLGAMENPGLVTFTEHYIFRSPATPDQYQARANTLLHEMSHMWFGDLVTPRWWGDLWLKESFAEFMGTFLSVEASGFGDAWLNFAGRRKLGAYVADAMPTTHPVVAAIPDLEAAKNNFDRITYSKGASALTQLVHFVGLNDFFAGCRAYFERFAHGNSSLADFLTVLGEATGRDLAQWSAVWLETSGHDVLTPELAVTDGRLQSLTVLRRPIPGAEASQRPHATTVGLYDLIDDRLRLRRRIDVILDGEATAVDVGDEPAPAAVVVNDTDQTFARIALDDATLSVLQHHLGDLEPLTRAVLWAALWGEVRDGRLPVRDHLRAAAHQGQRETETGTLSALVDHAFHALTTYLDQAAGDAVEWRDACRSAALGSVPGSPQQLVWAKAYLAAAALTDEDVAWVAEGGIPGLVVSTDLRWLAVRAQAAQGRATDADLEAALAADRTGTGEMQRLRAWASRPDAGLKREAWERAHTVGGETNDAVDALLLGAFAPGQADLMEEFAAPYFDGLLDVWHDHPIEIARRLVVLGHPVDPRHLPASEAWLAEHDDAPAALRRLVLERHHELAIAHRLRTLSRGVDGGVTPSST